MTPRVSPFPPRPDSDSSSDSSVFAERLFEDVVGNLVRDIAASDIADKTEQDGDPATSAAAAAAAPSSSSTSSTRGRDKTALFLPVPTDDVLPEPPPRPVAVAARRRAVPGQRLAKYKIESYGSIKVDRNLGNLNAHCSCLGIDADLPDHRTPTMPECRLHRIASKAPLGFLVAWLRMGPHCASREEHYVYRTHLSLEERKERAKV